MSRRWVVNASPLILLGKVGRTDLLSQLTDELIVPAAVVREIGIQPEGRRLLDLLQSTASVRIGEECLIPSIVEGWNLGQGESQVLALAVSHSVGRAVLDDLQARRCALSLDVPVIGTLGVILRAKRRGLIAEARPVVDAVRRAGLYASESLVERALLHLGE